MQNVVRIPRSRVPALMGPLGKSKKKIEDATRATLSVDEDGTVQVDGDVEGALTATEMVKAVGRGFTVERALILEKEENQLVIISMQGETENTIKRLFARVIGTHGKARMTIEKLTGTWMSVSGKTVAILGEAQMAYAAGQAVEELLAGRKHSYVYAKLEKQSRAVREEQFGL